MGDLNNYDNKKESNQTNTDILDKHLKGGIETLKKSNELNESVFTEQINSILNRLFIYPPLTDDKETELNKITKRGPWNKINKSVEAEINKIEEITESLGKATNDLKEQV